MKQKLFPILLLLLTLSLACSSPKSSNDIIVRSFPKSLKVLSSPVEDIEVLSRGNVNLVVVDSFLIIQKDDEPMLEIFNTNNHDLLVSFGKKGKGPTDFEGPDLIKQIKRDSLNGSPIIHVFDFSRRRISKINILEAIKNKDSGINQRRIDELDGYLLRYFYEDENFILAKDEGDWRFVRYDYSDSSTYNIPYLPEIDYLENQRQYKSVFRSTVTVNKKKGLIATGTMLLGELNFYNLKGEYLKSTIFTPRKDVRRAIKKGGLIEASLQIMDIQSTEEKIYALNYNNLQRDVHEPTHRNDAKVQVFDWDGNPLIEYILADNMYISYFAYDEKNNRIYGYAPDQKEHNIVMYDLNQ